MTNSDIIRDVSLDLNDQEPGYEYTRWTRRQLSSYLKEALVQISQQLEDWFVSQVVVKLEPGGDWQKACDCTSIIRIDGESTADGHVVRYLRRLEDIEEFTWPGAVQRCPISVRDYKLESYTIDSNDETQFRVFPPVPSGADRFVTLKCHKIPEGNDEDTVPAKAVAMVKQWMLYRALSVDSENNPSIIQLANNHKETFFTLLGTAVEKKREEEKRYDSLRTVPNEAAR
mgnify:CR=1 FL=1